MFTSAPGCYDDIMTFLLRLLAFIVLAIIIYLTLGPVSVRSVSPMPPQLDRALAFFVLGLLFTIAYPRHFWAVAALTLVVTAGLELAQMLFPGRHGREIDAALKLAGAAFGIASGGIVKALRLV